MLTRGIITGKLTLYGRDATTFMPQRDGTSGNIDIHTNGHRPESLTLPVTIHLLDINADHECVYDSLDACNP